MNIYNYNYNLMGMGILKISAIVIDQIKVQSETPLTIFNPTSAEKNMSTHAFLYISKYVKNRDFKYAVSLFNDEKSDKKLYYFDVIRHGLVIEFSK